MGEKNNEKLIKKIMFSVDLHLEFGFKLSFPSNIDCVCVCGMTAERNASQFNP